METGTKNCNKCSTERKIEDFYISRNKRTSVCKYCDLKRITERYKKNKIRLQEYGRSHYRKNSVKRRAQAAAWKRNNPEREKQLDHNWYLKNKPMIMEKARIRMNERRKTDPSFRLLHNLRGRIGKAIRGIDKSKTTKQLLGCEIDFLMKHLESQFRPGMSWDTYGKYGWWVDHIKPCVSFNLLDEEEQKKCFHWTNLQPLWATENMSKNDRYPYNNSSQ